MSTQSGPSDKSSRLPIRYLQLFFGYVESARLGGLSVYRSRGSADPGFETPEEAIESFVSACRTSLIKETTRDYVGCTNDKCELYSKLKEDFYRYKYKNLKYCSSCASELGVIKYVPTVHELVEFIMRLDGDNVNVANTIWEELQYAGWGLGSIEDNAVPGDCIQITEAENWFASNTERGYGPGDIQRYTISNIETVQSISVSWIEEMMDKYANRS